MIEEYIRGDSVIHRLDPRVKIFFALVFSITIALNDSLGGAMAGFAAGVILTALSGISLKQVIKRMIVVNEFIVILWLILPLTFAADDHMIFHGIPIAPKGIAFALLLTIKSNAIVLITINLLATSSIFDIVHGLRHLLVPDKIVFLFFLIYRYTWVIFDEYDRIVRAIKARGFKMKTTIHTYRTTGYLVGSLLVKSYQRAENLYKAMVCRGYNGRFWIFDHFRFGVRDAFAGAVFAAGNILIIFIRWIKITY